MIVSRSRMMKMLLKSCFSVVSLDFHRFYRHVLAGSTGNGRILFSFGDTYLHLPRDRVPESLWKPHQSKAINFLHRNYVPTFFPTPTKKYFFFGIKNIFRKKIGQKYFSVKIRENPWNSKNFVRKSKFQIFSGFSPENIFCCFFFEKYFWSRKKIFFGWSWKKSWYIVSM
jgi:hypothetical protein